MKAGMYNHSSLTYVENKNINRAKWDACIESASHPLIYAYSFYLDAMAKYWDALVMDDYKAVMPLTWNKKYGVHYLYQPFLCASLGLFAREVTAMMLTHFLNSIPKRFKYWDIYLNASNNFLIENYPLAKRINYVLQIQQDYPTLFKDFRSSYRQLIHKKNENQLEVKQNIDVGEILRTAEDKLRTISRIKKVDFANFEKLYNELYAKKDATNYGVYLEDELLASGIFLLSGKRAYYVLAGNKTSGRRYGASQIVIDAFIQQHAGNDMLLDFEGSNVPGIAFFFKGFGAKVEEYPGLRYNALPAFLRLLKK